MEELTIRCFAGAEEASVVLYAASGFAGRPDSERFVAACAGHRTGLTPKSELYVVGNLTQEAPLAVAGLAMPCLFGCPQAAGLFYAAGGCACYPGVLFQPLCMQHWVNAEPLGVMVCLGDFTGGLILQEWKSALAS